MRRGAGLSIFAAIVWLSAWAVAAVFILPVAMLVVAVSLVVLAVRIFAEAPSFRRWRARRDLGKLQEQVTLLLESSGQADADALAADAMQQLAATGYRPIPELAAVMHAAIRKLFELDGMGAAPAVASEDPSMLSITRQKDELRRWLSRMRDPAFSRAARDTIQRAMQIYCEALPQAAFSSETARSPSGTTLVPLRELLPSAELTIERLVQTFCSEGLISSNALRELRERLERNRHDMSGFSYSPFIEESRKLIQPTQHKGTKDEIIRGYLSGTPLADLFGVDLPFTIPQQTRFEHQWIVAGSGHGKTQALQYLLSLDLERVAKGHASVVLIDSQTEAIGTISRLKMFAPGQPLHRRLCLIDPTDIDFPPALNLFDIGIDRIEQYGALDRERLLNSVLELFDYVFTALLSAELTQKQNIVFRFITRLLLQIPEATIHTFRELMEPKGAARFQPFIAKLDGTARAFFETEFDTPQFQDTKRQVLRRLWGVLENRTFERMFSHPRSKLDLFSEINSGKVILINAAKELLKQNGTELLGRFFIALIAQAAQERMTLPKEKRLPTFVYVDEAADYADSNVATILEQARKANIGIVLAHQYVGQLSPKLQESFAANTSIKFAGGCSDKDARTFSHLLRCSPEFIEARKKLEFAVFVRNSMASAISLRIPPGHLEKMPQMSSNEFEQVRADMRARYATPAGEMPSNLPPSAPARSIRSHDPDDVDTAPMPGWS